MKNARGFNRWLFGYCAVILIVMSVTLVGHIFVVNISFREIEKSSADLVMQAKKLCDESVQEAELLASRLLSSPTVANISVYNPNMDKNMRDYVLNMNSDITTILKISKVVKEAYIVFSDMNVCVNHLTKFDINNFYSVYFSEYFSSEEECMRELFPVDDTYKSYNLLSRKNGERKVAFVYSSTYPARSNRVYAVFILDVDNMLSGYAGENMGEMVFVDQENSPLTKNGGLTEPLELPEQNGSAELKIGNNHYVVNYAASRYLPGKFVHLIDKSDYFKFTKTVSIIIVVSYILCLLFGLFIAWLMARKNYNFVSNLADKLDMTERQMKKQRNRLRESMIANVVNGNSRYIREDIRVGNMFAGGERLAVVLFDILDYGVNDKDDKEMTQFVISNVFSELAAESCGACVDYCGRDEYYAGIVSFDDKAVSAEDIKRQADCTNEFLNKNLGVSFNSAVSAVFTGAKNIAGYCTETEKVLKQEAEMPFQTDESVRCQNIKQYVKDNYASAELSVQSIADHFNLSFGYISRYFKDKTGQGLAKYIIEVRIDKAKELLENTDETCSKIAAEVGFLSDHVFIKNFSKIEGDTPGAYRDKMRK